MPESPPAKKPYTRPTGAHRAFDQLGIELEGLGDGFKSRERRPGSVGGECLAQLPKLLLHLTGVRRQLALGHRALGARRPDEREIRLRVVTRGQIAPAGLAVLRSLQRCLGPLAGKGGTGTAAALHPNHRGWAGRTVGSRHLHALQKSGAGDETEGDQKSRQQHVTRLRAD